MTHEQALIWREALESGKWTQWRGSLHNKFAEEEPQKATAFCCLGVAHKVLHPNTPLKNTTDTCKLLGLDEKYQEKFATMNDEAKMTFPEIGAWIREYIDIFTNG